MTVSNSPLSVVASKTFEELVKQIGAIASQEKRDSTIETEDQFADFLAKSSCLESPESKVLSVISRESFHQRDHRLDLSFFSVSASGIRDLAFNNVLAF